MKVALIILDGFGHTEKKEHNAIYQAQTPHLDEWFDRYPNALLETSGEAVGLPRGVMGNSEVGHLCIGAGRIIKQDVTRISEFAAENGFEELPDLRRVMKDPSGALHLIGLVSDGQVHSDIEHLIKLVESIQRTSPPEKRVFIHAITDGRDTAPDSGQKYLARLQKTVDRVPQVKIATVVGRFYAMDRDQRWERVEEAYRALTRPGATFTSADEAIQDAYAAGETDEFVKPRQTLKEGRIASGDQVVFFNFRADRARELSMAFGLKNFAEFKASVKIDPPNWVCFTRYREDFPFPYLFSKQSHQHILGELVSKAGLQQLRIAETEKYAHVTYFFNGGVEEPFAGEERVLVPSPKDVKTYDLKPEMSAFAVTEKVIKALEQSKFDFIVMNYANGDMVGHTGVEPAAISAVEALDSCLDQVVKKALEKGFEVLITADHGNCEEMVDEKTGKPFTQHTTNPVPLLWIGEMARTKELRNGILADIAPTILAIFGWEKPNEMSGRSLMIDPSVLMKC